MSELVISDQPEESRYEAVREDTLVGYIDYETAGDVLTLTHTVVPEEFGGQGIASGMARGVLDDIRGRGQKLVPQCSFVAGYIGKHPEYADLVADA